MSTSDLRELFEACKTGDLVKVKKLLTAQNVNEIGESSWVSNAQGLLIVEILKQIRLVDDPLLYTLLVDTVGKTS